VVTPGWHDTGTLRRQIRISAALAATRCLDLGSFRELASSMRRPERSEGRRMFVVAQRWDPRAVFVARPSPDAEDYSR
jgi:hypothetical protein